jgi:UDP-N-acetylmuramoyl-tripeptide--D-alanyl-D-alanine ligase
MKKLWTRYTPRYIATILYMLQASEYQIGDYMRWFHRSQDFRNVMKRRSLEFTLKIKLLGAALVGVTVVWAITALTLVLRLDGLLEVTAGVVLLAVLPWVLAYGVVVPLWVGYVLVQAPKERRMILAAQNTLRQHPATKIAIAGSFGKTTMKEVLRTVLAEGKKVAATPGNMNTAIGISRFVQRLDGTEEVLIFELGESHVGDVRDLCELVQPDMGIITGINEAHLSTFKTLDRTVSTIFELQDYLGDRPLYKNIESELVRSRVADGYRLGFGRKGTNGWHVSDAETTIQGTSFSIKKDSKIIWAHTQLLGLHVIGVTAVAVSIADSFGLSASHITSGLKKVKPFEHRMEPRELHGAWIIDDTYNGNKEGVEAGLKLLKQLEAKRRVYVTPGLVEQGEKNKEIHIQIGKWISGSADVVVLMNNSVVDYISEGLKQAGYKGRTLIIDDPLDFYTHIDQFVAAGDVVLMQNDWTDNYA